MSEFAFLAEAALLVAALSALVRLVVIETDPFQVELLEHVLQ